MLSLLSPARTHRSDVDPVASEAYAATEMFWQTGGRLVAAGEEECLFPSIIYRYRSPMPKILVPQC